MIYNKFFRHNHYFLLLNNSKLLNKFQIMVKIMTCMVENMCIYFCSILEIAVMEEWGWGGVTIIDELSLKFNDVSAVFADNDRPVTVQGERGGFGFSFVFPPAEGVLSVKRKLTFMLGPQMRPVLSVGRFLGAAGMQSSSEMKAAPHRSSRPPAPSVGRRYSMCAWICASYTCLRQRWSTQRPNPQALLC